MQRNIVMPGAKYISFSMGEVMFRLCLPVCTVIVIVSAGQPVQCDDKQVTLAPSCHSAVKLELFVNSVVVWKIWMQLMI